MKKSASLVLAAVLALSVMAGCAQKTSGTVTTDGSTSMEKVSTNCYIFYNFLIVNVLFFIF